MFTESADLYDAIYFSFKDYPAEAETIAALLRELHPEARTILDVACGTAEHARLLTGRHGYAIDGIDISEDFLRIARGKNPAGHFLRADMADFDLGRTYDVVMCLFSSIGYLVTQERVTQALRCFARHVAPGGVVVVEPWFTPDAMKPGHVSVRTAQIPGGTVERTSTLEIDDRVTRLRFDYVITSPEGVRRATEHHVLGLLTVEEMLAAFRAAGLRAEHRESDLTGRGLYTARPA